MRNSSAVRTGEETPSNWWNRIRYGVDAPVYDWVAWPFEAGRKRAVERVEPQPDDRILVLGCGTGMDLDYLPHEATVTAIDVSESMVRRTESLAESLGMDLIARVADARSVPFEDDTFDVVLLHLVISVVPQPKALVDEAARVLGTDGRIAISEKFIPAGSNPSVLRRAVNPLARLLVADLNRRLAPLLAEPDLELESRDEFLGGVDTVTIAGPAGDG